MSAAPAIPKTETLAEKFNRLTALWRKETAYQSSLAKITTHSAYLEIISLGQAAVPLLLQDMEREPDHWHIALKAITGANPVAAADGGNLSKTAEAWLRWGKENGYRW